MTFIGTIHLRYDVFVAMETKLKYKSKILLCATYQSSIEVFFVAGKVIYISVFFFRFSSKRFDIFRF